MALPKLENPTYELELPSTGETIKFRPFLVKEQKHLLMAMESEEGNMMKDTLGQLVSNCTFEAVDPLKLPMFDVEYLFLQIRAKSVGETVTLNLLCPDDEKTRVKKEVKLADVAVHMGNDHTNEIKVTDNIKIVMRYPNLQDYLKISDKLGDVETVFEMMRICIEEIHEGDKVHQKIDVSDVELSEFIDNLPSDVIDRMGEFFDTMPKLQHVIKVTNPKTKKKGEVKVEGLQSFFV
tara:strand:+ start:5728 stop:6435 length:708 start_codon:yes stop_codon:yes gene_type:complete